MGFSKLESAISGQIATLFQKRGAVEPSALIKSIEREVVKQQKKSANGLIVPNDYVIYLSEEDCHRLSAARIIKALHETVERKIIRENCFMDGKLSVRIEKMIDDDEVIKIKSKFIDDKNIDEDTINLNDEKFSNTQDTIIESNEKTIIADKNNFQSAQKLIYPQKIERQV